jgi:hypothetical protein
LWYPGHGGSLWSSWAFSSIVKRFGLWKEAYQQRPVEEISGQA